MKKKYSTLPKSMINMEMYGFNWMEFVISVPSPLYIMTFNPENFKGTAHDYVGIIKKIRDYSEY